MFKLNPLATLALVGLLASCAPGPTEEGTAQESTSQQAATTVAIETVAQITVTRPGNIAVTPRGRIIVTNQPLDSPGLRAIEVLADGSTQPFPTLDWADGPATGEVGIAATIGIASSSEGVIWILDMGGEDSPPQLIAWDTVQDTLLRELEIPADVVTPISFLQDFALDEKRGQIYIADMTFPAPGDAPRPAFVVVDLESGQSRRVLEGSASLMPVDHDIVIGGSLVGTVVDEQSTPWRLGVNPIAIDPSFEWVYFGTVNGDDVFRLPAAALADPSLGRDELEASVETYAKKRPSDGIAVDDKGRVFISDIEASAVGIATPDGYEVLAQDDVRLAWPDGFALGPDGSLWVTQNHLHAHPALNEGVDETVKPFHVLKLNLNASWP